MFNFRRPTRGWDGRGLPCPFLKYKEKCPDFLGKKALIRFIHGLDFSFKMLFKVYLGKKSPKFFPVGPFFLVLQLNVYRNVLILRNLPCPEKFLVTRLNLRPVTRVKRKNIIAAGNTKENEKNV